jgi:hypothetical protein
LVEIQHGKIQTKINNGVFTRGKKLWIFLAVFKGETKSGIHG